MLGVRWMFEVHPLANFHKQALCMTNAFINNTVRNPVT